jgi:hypothetical protein
MLRMRTLPAGFIAPCLPTKADTLPSGGLWIHEIKHDGFRIIARIPGVLAEALQATLALMPSSEGQKTAQREIATALETALDARRQRIIISQSQVNLLKWSILFMQAVCALVAIAMVHSDNRLASIIAMGIFDRRSRVNVANPRP